MAGSAMAEAVDTTAVDPAAVLPDLSDGGAAPGPDEAKDGAAPVEQAAGAPETPKAGETPAPAQDAAADFSTLLTRLNAASPKELDRWLNANPRHPLHQLLEDRANARAGQAVERARKQERDDAARAAETERQRQYDELLTQGAEGDWEAKDQVFAHAAEQRRREAAEQARADVLNDPELQTQVAEGVVERLTEQITTQTEAHSFWGQAGEKVLRDAYTGTPTVPDYYALAAKAIIDKGYTPNKRVKELTEAAHKAGRDARNGATPDPDLTPAHEAPHSDGLQRLATLTEKWQRDGELSDTEKKELRALNA